MVMKTRRPGDPMAAAEAVFRSAKPQAVVARPSSAIPVGKEAVSLRIDRDVLEHFQEDGPGWQERINAVLREAAALVGSTDEGKRPEELDASNDG